MRVLIVSHGHPELSPGGAEIASYTLFNALKQVADVEAFYLSWDEQEPNSAAPGRILRFRDRPDEFIFHVARFDRFLFSQGSPVALDEYRVLLEDLRPDVIHMHHYLNIGLDFIRISRLIDRKTRIFLTLHEYYAICHHAGLMMRAGAGLAFCTHEEPHACAQCFPDRSPREFAERKARIASYFDDIDRLIAPSVFLRDRYVAWGVPSWQIVVLDNAVETPPQHPAPRVERNRSPNRFAYFGQIHPYKGLLQLLAAFEQIAASSKGDAKGLELTIHGAHLELNAADYSKAFRAALARCGKRVAFAGAYERRELASLMAQADWVVVPSIWWENSPLVIEEALAHRRPVLCSNIGGMAEKVRPGLDGFHFEVGDVRALADLLVRVAKNRKIWNDLQHTLRRPTALGDAVAAHLEVYRDRTFTFT